MSKLRIFYTDDDEDDQLLFEEIIRNIDAEHQVLIQSHGEDLMSVLKQDVPEPDIIFLDLNMPHKNGFQVLQEMKADDGLADLPVVIFSTSNNEKNIAHCKELGADGYICKPTSYTDMKIMLEEVLSMDWKRRSPSKKEFFYIQK